MGICTLPHSSVVNENSARQTSVRSTRLTVWVEGTSMVKSAKLSREIVTFKEEYVLLDCVFVPFRCFTNYRALSTANPALDEFSWLLQISNLIYNPIAVDGFRITFGPNLAWTNKRRLGPNLQCLTSHFTLHFVCANRPRPHGVQACHSRFKRANMCSYDVLNTH